MQKFIERTAWTTLCAMLRNLIFFVFLGVISTYLRRVVGTMTKSSEEHGRRLLLRSGDVSLSSALVLRPNLAVTSELVSAEVSVTALLSTGRCRRGYFDFLWVPPSIHGL